MSNFKEIVNHLKSKEYYVRLMEILVINGLLDIFEEELKDGKIDYLPLIINIISFLEKNKKHYISFSSDKLENIIILSVDEILNKKFKIDLDEEQLNMVLQLVKNSYLFKSALTFIKDAFIKIYFKCKTKCKCGCFTASTSDVIIQMDKSRSPKI